MQLPKLRSRGPQLAKASKREGQTETSERRIRIVIEVTTEHLTLNRRQEFAIVAVEFLAKLPVFAVEDRNLTEQRQYQTLNRRRVGQTAAILFDQNHIGSLRKGIGGEHKEVPTACADHSITNGDPCLAQRQRCLLRYLLEAEDHGLGASEVETIPTLPQ